MITGKQYYALLGYTNKVGSNYDFETAKLNGLTVSSAIKIIGAIKSSQFKTANDLLKTLDPNWKLKKEMQDADSQKEDKKNADGFTPPNELPKIETETPDGSDKDIAQAFTSLTEALTKAKKERDKFALNVLELGKQVDILEKEKNELQELLNAKKDLPQYTPGSADYIKPPQYDWARWCIENNHQITLTGPAGTGKSRMIREIAKDMGLPYMAVSLGGGQRYTEVIGGMSLKNGNTEFEPSSWIKLASTEPCVIALEEIFGLDPEVLLGLNQAFEQGCREIETKGGKIAFHNGAHFVAISNTTGREISAQYTGPQRSDDSILDRFPVAIKMEYSEDTELSIAKKAGLSANQIEVLTKNLKSLRDNCRKFQIMFDPSTRRFITAVTMVTQGLEPIKAFEAVFLGTLSVSEKAKLGYK